MQIDIPNDDYRRLANQAATAGFPDVAAYLGALASAPGDITAPPCTESPHRRANGDALPALLDDLSAEEAIAALRPPVIDDPAAGAAESWPPDEPIGDWVEDLRRLRGQGALRPLP